MATTFEQQCAEYERSIEATHGRNAPSLVDQTKLLLMEWKNNGALSLVPHPPDCVCLKNSLQSDKHHCPVTLAQVHQLQIEEERRWLSAEKRYQVSNMFCQNVLLAAPDKLPTVQIGGATLQPVNAQPLHPTLSSPPPPYASVPELQQTPRGQFPVHFDRDIGQQVYKPWSLVDIEAYVSKLPSLSRGANIWITELNNLTANVEIAVMDLRAILARIKGSTWLHGFEISAGTLHIADKTPLVPVCTLYWDALRLKFPMRTDVALMRMFAMKPDEYIHDYIIRAHSHYFQTMSAHYDRDESHVQNFRDMVLKGLPEKLYDALADEAGLNVKSQSDWQGVVLHYYNRYMKEKSAQSESNAETQRAIALLQLQELVRQKKKVNKDKEASDQATCEMLMVSAVSSAPQPMGEGLAFPQSWFRGHTCREPGRRRKKSSYRGQFRKSMQYVKCWRCCKYGHVNRYCPHFLPSQNHKDN